MAAALCGIPSLTKVGAELRKNLQAFTTILMLKSMGLIPARAEVGQSLQTEGGVGQRIRRKVANG